MTFRELYMKGELEFDEIFDYTEKWNFSEETCTLREYLGLTHQEEDIWISESDEALEELMEKEKNTKILFLDMDGTMLNDRKEFTDGNRKALKKALAEGHKVVIATGRPLVSALVLAKDLGITGKGCYIIAFNGGEIYDTYRKKSIYKKTIPMEYVRYIFDAAKEMNLHCQTYCTDEILAEADTPELNRYMERTKISSRVVVDVTKELNEEPVKILVIDLEDHERLASFRESTTDWCEGKLDRIFSSVDYLEHIAPGISKGNAMEFLCDYLGFPMSNTVAAGDAENDVSMIKAAAIGVAMANADENVKAVADYITKRNNNEDGVSEIIGKFLI